MLEEVVDTNNELEQVSCDTMVNSYHYHNTVDKSAAGRHLRDSWALPDGEMELDEADDVFGMCNMAVDIDNSQEEIEESSYLQQQTVDIEKARQDFLQVDLISSSTDISCPRSPHAVTDPRAIISNSSSNNHNVSNNKCNLYYNNNSTVSTGQYFSYPRFSRSEPSRIQTQCLDHDNRVTSDHGILKLKELTCNECIEEECEHCSKDKDIDNSTEVPLTAGRK